MYVYAKYTKMQFSSFQVFNSLIYNLSLFNGTICMLSLSVEIHASQKFMLHSLGRSALVTNLTKCLVMEIKRSFEIVCKH